MIKLSDYNYTCRWRNILLTFNLWILRLQGQEEMDEDVYYEHCWEWQIQ